MDLQDLLKNLIESQQEKPDLFLSRKEAHSALTEFMNLPLDTIKEGDMVELNELGKERYTLPSANQVAMCACFKEPTYDNKEGFTNMVIVVACAKKIFRYFPVDSRFYQKAKENKNVYIFAKK